MMNDYNETFVIARSLAITKKYGNISFNERVSLLAESIVLDDRKLVLNMIGEGLYSINLVEGIIKKLDLDKSKFKIILGMDPKGKLSDYDVEVNPYGLCNASNFYRNLQTENIDWENIKLSHKLIALSHRPTISRALYIKDLLDFYKEDVLVSFGFGAELNDDFHRIMSPHTIPISIDIGPKQAQNLNNFHTKPSDVIFQNLFHLVMETLEVDDDEIRITEKSYKPFAWHQIPIYVVNTEHFNKLRKLGFDMFDDILDNNNYNNGSVYNYRLRVMSIIKKIFNQYPTIDDMQKLRNKLWDRLKYNNQLLNDMVSKDTYDWS